MIISGPSFSRVPRPRRICFVICWLKAKKKCNAAPAKHLLHAGIFRLCFDNMDWQQLTALAIVGVTAVVLLWRWYRPRKFSFERDTHCGCAAGSHASPQHSIVFRARKGQRPQVVVRMK
jgi:hypothetical protein